MTEQQYENLKIGDYIFHNDVGQRIIREVVEDKANEKIYTPHEDLSGIPYQFAYLTPEEAKAGEKLYEPLKEEGFER